MNTLILVNEQDQPIGVMDKLEAHQKGLLHRAVSIMVARQGLDGLELLLQKRAACKYHSENLWSNTCCTHPTPTHASTLECAKECLQREMGMTAKTIEHIGAFTYHATVSNGLIEHEVDHVFLAMVDKGIEPILNPAEASDSKWINIRQARSYWQDHQDEFSSWFEQVLSQVEAYTKINSIQTDNHKHPQ